ncbi:MAG: S41 family peptidase, partial [Vicinamibacterales bacterium]|nr:S41 family peptidase [Vicinamibacterales bacterium]
RRYAGSVVLITDARCYSTTDIFAAGFQDNDLGTILGVDNNTGAGGANVFRHSLLRQVLPGPNSPFKSLPGGADMRVAIRQTTRVGENNGLPLEDLGVTPNQVHRMTHDDVMEGNRDLIATAAALL